MQIVYFVSQLLAGLVNMQNMQSNAQTKLLNEIQNRRDWQKLRLFTSI